MAPEIPVDARSARLAALYATDADLQAARPLAAAVESARRPGTRLAEALSILVASYVDRPAVGTRATSVVRDPETGRSIRRLESRFDTMTYGQLWTNVIALAAAWTADKAVRPGDFVATIGFSSADYLTVELASYYLGLVTVPLQHNSAASRLRPIFAETEPRVLAVGAEYLDLAVECALSGPSLQRITVLDYHADDDSQRDALNQARVRLSETSVTLELFDDVIARGWTLPAPSGFTDADDQRLAMILYTSGSTGLPKGAMWTERMLRMLWTGESDAESDVPVRNVNFMPLNHLGGRIPLVASFQAGGTSYFVPKSDLSTLFEDLQLVRPTQLAVVPRVVDMLYQRYQTRIDRLRAEGEDPAAADAIAKTELRDDLLGGRVLTALVSTAPLSAEMRNFLEETIQVPLFDVYGTTETAIVSRDGVLARPPVIDYKLVDVPELGYFSTDRPYPRGELLVKTATATPGYYKRPEVTAEVFDADGYYRTGDVMAEVAADRLVYVDRRNNVLKLAQGEFVAVANLEAIYAGAPLIRQIFVYGNSERSSLLAVIVPTDESTTRYPDLDDLKAALRDSLRATAQSAELQSYELPTDFLVETDPFTADNGLLSGVGKLLRPKLKVHYSQRLEQMYADLAVARSDELRALREGADTATTDRHGYHGRSGAARAARYTPRDRRTLHRPGRRFVVRAELLQPARRGLRCRGARRSHHRPVRGPCRAGRLCGGRARLQRSSSHRHDRARCGCDIDRRRGIDPGQVHRRCHPSGRHLVACRDHPVQTVLLTGANGYLGASSPSNGCNDFRPPVAG